VAQGVSPEEIPEINISSDNARSLLELLAKNGFKGFDPEDLTGEIGVNDLEQIFSNIDMNPKMVNEYTREEEIEGDGTYEHVYFGLTEDKIRGYFDRLYNLINYAIENGYESISYY